MREFLEKIWLIKVLKKYGLFLIKVLYVFFIFFMFYLIITDQRDTQKVKEDKFEAAIEYILRNEGGLSNHPLDRGGLTKFGISKASYPNLDIRKLTRKDAIEIYRKDFYDRFKLERIKDQNILNKVFDMAVLMGKARATLIFESTLNKLGHQIPKDGILDDQMIAIINDYNSETLLAKYKEELKAFVRRIIEVNPSQEVFRKGWYARIDQ